MLAEEPWVVVYHGHLLGELGHELRLSLDERLRRDVRVQEPLALAKRGRGERVRGPQRRVNARLRLRKFETPGRRAASITAKAAGEVGWHSPGARIGLDGRLKWR